MLDTDWPTQLKNRNRIMSVSSLPSLEIITWIIVSSLLQSKLNTNRYATKKTIAQGMLDIALLSSNAAQLKYILTVSGFLQQSTLMNWLDRCFVYCSGWRGTPVLLTDVGPHRLQHCAPGQLSKQLSTIYPQPSQPSEGFKRFDPSDNGSSEPGQGGI